MPLHIIKLCVGVDSIEHLAALDREELKRLKRERRKPELVFQTRQMPKRAGEIVPGGSVYWVIKGVVQVRQPLLALRPAKTREGLPACDMVFANTLVAVRPVPRRAFQGWRYLEESDAPPDLSGDAKAIQKIPESMRRELMALGLI
ncbi:MAG: DUF1489 domain-containing protein [Hyphomicrobiaceae bacterium]